MADLTIRRAGATPAANYDPFESVRASMRRIQDLFRDPYEIDPIALIAARGGNAFDPDFEVRETRDGLVFQADLPGVREEDVDITVVGNRLRISGKREFDESNRGDTWYAAERSYGTFTRNFVLPEGCDTNAVHARLENGVLSIELGKRQEAQPRRIALGGARPALEGGARSFEGGAQGARQPEGSGAAGGGGAGYGGMYGSQTGQSESGYGAAASGGEPRPETPQGKPGSDENR